MTPPKSPAGLHPAGRAAWKRGWETLDALGEDPPLSRDALFRYCEAIDVWTHVRDEWVKLGRPVYAFGGATGTAEVAHPLLRELHTARKEAQALGSALGFDPSGRRRLSRRSGAGRPQGAASAADRAQPARRRLRSVT